MLDAEWRQPVNCAARVLPAHTPEETTLGRAADWNRRGVRHARLLSAGDDVSLATAHPRAHSHLRVPLTKTADEVRATSTRHANFVARGLDPRRSPRRATRDRERDGRASRSAWMGERHREPARRPRFATRGRNNPGFALVSALTLALIGAGTSILAPSIDLFEPCRTRSR
jgi:hypothetical protein